MIKFLIFVSAIGHFESYSDEIISCQEKTSFGNFNNIELAFQKQG